MYTYVIPILCHMGPYGANSAGELRPNSNWRSVLGIPTIGSKAAAGKPLGLGIGNDVKKSWGKSEHILKSSRNAWGKPRCF